jgi:hypothetical protein
MYKSKIIGLMIIIAITQLVLISIITVQAETTPIITTDKADYAPTETVIVRGSGFKSNTDYYIPVIRPDGTIVLGDGTFTPGWDTIHSDTDGAFLYEYILDGVFGLYEVRLYDLAWEGDLVQEPLAKTTFMDAAKVTLDQTYNDQDPTDGTPDGTYNWGGGGINHENSILTEGNFPPPYPPYIPGHVNYRMIIESLPAGTYTIIIEYEFTKGGIPAFDFLTTSYDISETELKIDLPGSPADQAQFSAIIDDGVSDTEPFSDDPFAVGSTLGGSLVSDRQVAHDTAFSGESPIRALRIYGDATIEGIDQNDHTGPLTGDSKSSVNVTITKNSDESEPILLTWGGHIAIGQPYPAGYGIGYGAVSISGGPFHMYLNNIYDDEYNAVVNSGKNVNVQLGAVVFSSTTTTLLSQSTITLGQSITDTATVTGFGPTPTGTVDFEISSDGGTTWTTFDADVSLDGSGQATSISYTPATPGAYYFRAVYSGDDNYFGAQSGDEEEPLTVGKYTPDVNTLLSDSSITLGASVTDSVTVVGLGGSFPWPTGTVDFEVSFDGGAWTVYDNDVALTQSGSDGVATSTSYTPLAAGSYRFRAVYSGDSNYNGAQSGDEEEPLTVGKYTPTVTTLLSESTIALGHSVTDTATVSGLSSPFPDPTGTVDFQVSTDMISWITFDSNVPLVSGSATSDSYEPLTAGTYYFRAVYSGDNNYYSAQSGDNEEPLTVEPVYFVKTFTGSGSLTPGQEPPISPNGLETFVSQKKTGPAIWWEVTYTVTNEGPDGYFVVWDKWGGNLLVLGGTPTAFNSPALTLSNYGPFSINPREKNGGYRKYVEDDNLVFNSINADGLGTDDGTAYVTLHTGDQQQGTNPGKGKGTSKDGKSYDLDIRWEIGFLTHGETATFTIIVAPGMNPGSQLEFTSYGESIINTGPVIRAYEDPDFNDFDYTVPDTNQLTVYVGEAYEPDWLT